jgi:hypothetical protein
MRPLQRVADGKPSEGIEPKTVFHDEIDDRYSVRRIAHSDATVADGGNLLGPVPDCSPRA